MPLLHAFSEATLERRFAAVLKAQGHHSIHMSDPSKPGIPDRYVMGLHGMWVEVKQGRNVRELAKGFDRQRQFLDMLRANNERVSVLALLQVKNAFTLYLESWAMWKQREQHVAGWEEKLRGSPSTIATYDELDALIRNWTSFARYT